MPPERCFPNALLVSPPLYISWNCQRYKNPTGCICNASKMDPEINVFSFKYGISRHGEHEVWTTGQMTHPWTLRKRPRKRRRIHATREGEREGLWWERRRAMGKELWISSSDGFFEVPPSAMENDGRRTLNRIYIYICCTLEWLSSTVEPPVEDLLGVHDGHQKGRSQVWTL